MHVVRGSGGRASRRPGTDRIGVGIGARALAVGLVVLGMSASAAQAVVPAGNVVVNPGAEASAGGDSTETLPPVGWSSTPNATALTYAAVGFTDPGLSAAIGGGANVFSGGLANASSTASQTVSLAGAAGEIDTGRVTADFSAYLGGLGGQEDNVRATVTFRNAVAASLGATTIGPVNDTERGGNTTMLLRQALAIAVPVGTRSADVVLLFTRDDGTYNNSYADNVSLTFAFPNQAPVCQDVTTSGTSEQATVVTLPCVDPDGDAPLTYQLVTPPPASAGTVTLAGNQATFTPTEDFEGVVTFTYTATDPFAAVSTVKTVTITVRLTCGGLTPTIRGTAGRDKIKVSMGSQVIAGLGGNDEIKGGSNDDVICGGAGDDKLIGEAANDRIFGGSGNDEILAEVGNDTVFGGAGNDDIEGEGGNDVINAGPGNDSIKGDSGDDVIHGDAGNDTMTGDAGNDRLFGDADIDVLTAGNGNDALDGGTGAPDRCNGELGTDSATASCEVQIGIETVLP
jgi:Ca2+-binding RTX toxin-like protein